MKTFIWRLSAVLHRRLKVLAAREGTSMQAIVTRAVEAMLKEAK